MNAIRKREQDKLQFKVYARIDQIEDIYGDDHIRKATKFNEELTSYLDIAADKEYTWSHRREAEVAACIIAEHMPSVYSQAAGNRKSVAMPIQADEQLFEQCRTTFNLVDKLSQRFDPTPGTNAGPDLLARQLGLVSRCQNISWRIFGMYSDETVRRENIVTSKLDDLTRANRRFKDNATKVREKLPRFKSEIKLLQECMKAAYYGAKPQLQCGEALFTAYSYLGDSDEGTKKYLRVHLSMHATRTTIKSDAEITEATFVKQLISAELSEDNLAAVIPYGLTSVTKEDNDGNIGCASLPDRPVLWDGDRCMIVSAKAYSYIIDESEVPAGNDCGRFILDEPAVQ